MALLLVGCDGAVNPDVTQPFAAPVYDRSLNAPIKLVKTSTPNEQDLVESKVISTAGGVLRLGAHELSVPRRAVEHPTRFTMTAKHGNNLIVELTAVDQVTGQVVTHFKQSLQLKLSYASVPVTSSQVNRLVVVWLRDDKADGALVRERTTLQPSQQAVIGWVDHFSQFAMGMD